MSRNLSIDYDSARKSSRAPETALAVAVRRRFISVGAQDTIPTSTVSIEEACGQRIPGTSTFVPAYNILLGNNVIFSKRVAVIGAGSHASTGSLKKTFQDAGVNEKFFAEPFALKDHVIAYGPCVNKQKAVPVTILYSRHSQFF